MSGLLLKKSIVPDPAQKLRTDTSKKKHVCYMCMSAVFGVDESHSFVNIF